MSQHSRLISGLGPARYTSTRAIWAALFILGVLFGDSAMAADEIRDTIEEGIETYQRAMRAERRDERMALFARSEHLFSDAIERGARNASIETNRANAALQTARTGHAIWGYRRALEIDPSHTQARRNLEQARTRLPDWVSTPESSGFADTFFFWRQALSPSEVRLWAAGCFALAALGLSIALIRPGLTGRLIALIFSLLWIGLLAPGWIEQQKESRPAGVLIAEETTARSADARHAPPRFTEPLPAGTEFLVVEDRQAWLEIELHNGRRAWVPASAVAPLNQP